MEMPARSRRWGAGPATICRLSAEGTRWRVRVETREALDGYTGRFVFEPEAIGGRAVSRPGPTVLQGRSPEEILAAAHDVPERRLRELLYSLG